MSEAVVQREGWRPERLQRGRPALAVGLLAAGVLALFAGTLIDDAFITLNYADTLRTYGRWGFYPEAATNTATSPLNVMLTALVGLVVPNLVGAALVLAWAEVMVIFGALAALGRALFGSPALGAVAAVLVTANPLLVSTLGLEQLLYAALAALALLRFHQERWAGLGVTLGLLTLARPDGALLALVMAAFTLVRQHRMRQHRMRPFVRAGLAFAAVVLPWLLVSWVAIGGLVPDTLFIKVAQGKWDTWSFGNGLVLYARLYPAALALTLAPVPLAVLALRSRRADVKRLARLLVVFAVVYVAAYALLGVPPHHWYYAPVVLAGLFGAALALADGAASASKTGRRLSLAVPVGVVAGLGVLVAADGAARPAEAPIHSNWASPAQYRALAGDLDRLVPPGASVGTFGEVGTVGFYARRRLHNGFTMPERRAAFIEELERRGGFGRLFGRLNFYWYEPPPARPEPPYELVALPGAMRLLPPTPPSPLRDPRAVWPIESRWARPGRIGLLGPASLPPTPSAPPASP